MAEVTTGMSTTTSGGSPLAQFAKAKRKKKPASGNFIKGAIEHPGSLHRALDVPQGQTIPQSKIVAAANSSDANLRRKAQFAKTLKGLSGKR